MLDNIDPSSRSKDIEFWAALSRHLSVKAIALAKEGEDRGDARYAFVGLTLNSIATAISQALNETL